MFHTINVQPNKRYLPPLLFHRQHRHNLIINITSTIFDCTRNKHRKETVLTIIVLTSDSNNIRMDKQEHTHAHIDIIIVDFADIENRRDIESGRTNNLINIYHQRHHRI